MAEWTLLYGIGAPKAGTTWLYEYLRSHDQAHLRAVKELHYFNAVAEGRLASRAETLQRKAALMLKRGRVRDSVDFADLAAACLDPRPDHAGYLDYLCTGRGARRLVADITPAYCTLDTPTFALMDRIAPAARFLFILRDPVARLWSHVKMNAERAGHKGRALAAAAAQGLEEAISGRRPPLARRCDYRGTIERLLAAVPRERVMFAFFERLFSQASIEAICRFLGIQPRPADFNQAVLAGPKLAMTEAQAAAARAWLAPQYRFARDFFGNDLPRAWQKNLELV